MRATFYTLLLIAVPALMQAQTTFSTAVDYNDFIIEQQDNVGTAINTMMNNLDADSATLWRSYYDGKSATFAAAENIKNLSGFNGNTEFRDASVALFLFYYSVFSNEYYQVLKIYTKEGFADEDLNSINGIIESIVDRETTYDENFAAAQEKFAKDNGFELIDGAESDEDY